MKVSGLIFESQQGRGVDVGERRVVTVSVVEFIYLQVFRSIGYKSIPIDDQIPFDKRRGVIPNINGRVINTGLNSVITCN